MAKDKPRKRISMRDLNPVVDTVPVKQEDTIQMDYVNDEFNAKLIEYNEKVLDLDPYYTSLKMRRDILVRVFVRPMQRSDNGVLIPNKAQIKIPTNAGVGAIGYTDNRYPYESKAVIVALPEGIKDLKVGMIVGLTNAPVMAIPAGRGNDVILQIPKAFIHPEQRGRYVEEVIGTPEDASDPNYGYLAISDFDIQTILS